MGSLSSSLQVNAISVSGLINKVMVDPKTSAVTMNSGISKVTDVER